MQLKSVVLGGVLALLSFSVFSQELYIPRNIQQAYEKGTRSKDGKPGNNYWQNRGEYAIKFEVNPPERTVKGSAEIIYANNSPDTLKKLNFKLIINHHKPGAPRARQVSEDYLTSGLHIDQFKEDGETGNWQEKENDGTNKFVKLNTPLLPGKKVSLTIDWHYKVSKQSGREGAISRNTFFVGYAYPRVAVYDDYAGWDVMPHTTAQEFYNDFNDYTFEVSVPADYLVWATGKLQNPEQVLQPHYAERYKKSKTSDSVIHIVTQKDLDQNKVITQQNGGNTWKWKAPNVTDVAFAVSNEYKWDASSVEIAGKRVSAQAAYDEKARDFEQMVDFVKHSVQWFSEEFPGVTYPYPKMTVVRGFADMEFPMMANDSSLPENPEFTRFVAEHEIAHTFFPFLTGTNETRWGFMDEGWAVTMEYLISIADLGKQQATENYQNFRVKNWIKDPSFQQDLPIITPTNVLSGKAMGNNEYGKASLAYLALRDLLGEQKFDEILRKYVDRWKGKHPMPWDFFYSFNNFSGQNLNWFWENWFFSNNYIDYAIENVDLHGSNALITLKNIGGFAAPVNVEVTLADGRIKQFHQSPEIWKDHKDTVIIKLQKLDNVKAISLKGGIFMDADLADNTWTN